MEYEAQERLATRIQQGHRYLETIVHPPWSRWVDGYEAHRARSLSVEESLSLVHPGWQELPPVQLQGRRRFALDATSRASRCQAARVWGYDCRLTADEVHGDHLFPYAFGGPTVPENRVLLCPVHNAAKAADIHLFPWEAGLPGWLDVLVERIARRRTA